MKAELRTLPWVMLALGVSDPDADRPDDTSFGSANTLPKPKGVLCRWTSPKLPGPTGKEAPPGGLALDLAPRLLEVGAEP